MCLSSVTITYDQPSELIVDGWKNFAGTSSQPRFDQYGGDVQLDAWLVAEIKWGNSIRSDDGKQYKPGFHIYADEGKAARANRRVYLRKVTCEGEQAGCRVLIAQEMYVPSTDNGWPPKETPPDVPVVAKRKRRWGKG